MIAASIHKTTMPVSADRSAEASADMSINSREDQMKQKGRGRGIVDWTFKNQEGDTSFDEIGRDIENPCPTKKGGGEDGVKGAEGMGDKKLWTIRGQEKMRASVDRQSGAAGSKGKKQVHSKETRVRNGERQDAEPARSSQESGQVNGMNGTISNGLGGEMGREHAYVASRKLMEGTERRIDKGCASKQERIALRRLQSQTRITCANTVIWRSIQPTMQNLQTRLSDKDLADMHADELEWPDATTLAVVGKDTQFKALGVNVSADDLDSFRLPDSSDTRQTLGYVSGAAIDFALASLATKQDSRDPSGPDIYHIGQHVDAVCSSFCCDVTEKTAVSSAKRILKKFNPMITPMLIIPGNLLNMHWLFILLDFRTNTAAIWNSMKKALPKALNRFTAATLLLAQAICFELGHEQAKAWNVTEESALQQENGYDCCLHVVCNCINIARKHINQLTHVQVKNSRKWLLWKILQHLPMSTFITDTTRIAVLPSNIVGTDTTETRTNSLSTHQLDVFATPLLAAEAATEVMSEAEMRTIATVMSTGAAEVGGVKAAALTATRPKPATKTAVRPDTDVLSINVGPCGIRDSIAHILPIFYEGPGVVMIQDAKLTGQSIKKFKALAHKMLPDYAVYTRSTLNDNKDKAMVVTFIHLGLSARGSQIDIHRMTSPDPSIPIKELAGRIQAIKTIDVHTNIIILWINVYNYQATQVPQQKALLELFRLIIVEWGPKVDYIVGGGDFNASLSPRHGYSLTTATKQADKALHRWFELLKSAPIVSESSEYKQAATRARCWEVHEPNKPTWNSTTDEKRSVLDRFFTLGIGQPSCTISESPHVVHDHSVVRLTIDTSIISPLPPHEDMIKPARLKMESWEKKKQEWASKVTQELLALGEGGPVDRLEIALRQARAAAEEIVGMSSPKKASLIPFHSYAFKKLTKVMRTVKAARTDLMKRQKLGPTAPSKSMKLAWDMNILPETKAPFTALNNAFSPEHVKWTSKWLITLKSRFEELSCELRSLRYNEISSAAKKCREARIERMERGGCGEIQRFLGKRGPAVSAPYVATEIPDGVDVTCTDLLDAKLVEAAVLSAAPSTKTRIKQSQANTVDLFIREIEPSQLASVLNLSDGRRRRLNSDKIQHVHEASNRLCAWESHLTKEAVATRTKCNTCCGTETTPVSVVTQSKLPFDCLPERTVKHFCTHCCTFVTPRVALDSYEELPFPTDAIPKVAVDANETLAGEILLEDLKHRINQLARSKSPGDDGIVYEFLKDGPDELLAIIHQAINSLLTKTTKIPADWKGGMIKLLYKKGDPFLCKNYRPVVLLRAIYKLYTSILTDRLYNIAERHKLLHPSQEGFRRDRSCGRQSQSLLWAYEEAKRQGQTLVVTFLDFANAFNSVDHPALWKWLQTIGIPDVDMLEDLYTDSFYQAETPHGTSAKIYLTRGTKQGDGLSPLLFSLIFNLLLHALDATAVGHKSMTGLRTAARAFADDVALVATSVQNMSTLLEVVDTFCTWSGMRLNVAKSEISAWDFGRRTEPDTTNITINKQTLARLAPTSPFRYLGFRFSLLGQWDAEVAHVFATTKELLSAVTKHGYTVKQIASIAHSVATARFRFSASLVPWTDSQLNKLHKLWIRIQKAAWLLPPSCPNIFFWLPQSQAGIPVQHPKVLYLQALKQHIEQLALWDDDVLACSRLQYEHLLKKHGCSSQLQLTNALILQEGSRLCPMAALLRLSRELGMQARIPTYITGPDPIEGETLSWFTLRQRVKEGMGSDPPRSADSNKRAQSALKNWSKAVTALKLERPTDLPWKTKDREPFWKVPLFRGQKIHKNFSELVERWGKPSYSELKNQILGTAQTVYEKAKSKAAPRQRQQPPGVEKQPVLNNRLISIVLDDVTERTEKHEDFTLVTAKSLTRVDWMDATGQARHCCTVSQGRLGFLREQNSDCLHRLKEWVTQTERAEADRGCLSAQAGHRLQEASGANLLIGDSPLTASIAFASSWSNTLDRYGWTTPAVIMLPLLNMLNMTESTQAESLGWLGRQQPAKWWVITRKKTCSAASRDELNRIGTIVCVIKGGRHLLAQTGNWRTGCVKTVKSSEQWLIWAKKSISPSELKMLSERIDAMSLSPEGKYPFNSSSLAMREARHGPAGPYYVKEGIIAATDGSLRKDGSMGAAAVTLDGKIPTLTKLVSGEVSTTTVELSGLALQVKATPLDIPLTILSDSLTSLVALINTRRRDFSMRLRRHPQRQQLEDLIGPLNQRTAQTLLVKIRAHTGEPLNEAADEEAGRAANLSQETHPSPNPALCYFSDGEGGPPKLWSSRLAIALSERIASRDLDTWRKTLTSLDDLPRYSGKLPKGAMNRTETFLNRKDCCRDLLGASIRSMGKSPTARRLLQALGNTYPVQSKLHQWRQTPSPACRLCHCTSETLCHSQCVCPKLARARRSAHHHGWTAVIAGISKNTTNDWSFHTEMTASTLAKLAPPSEFEDRNVEWGNLKDVLALENGAQEEDTETHSLATLVCNIIDRQENSEALQDILAIKTNNDLLLSACCNDREWLEQNTENTQVLLDLLVSEIMLRETDKRPKNDQVSQAITAERYSDIWWGDETLTDIWPIHRLICEILACFNNTSLNELLSQISNQQVLLSACNNDRDWLDQNLDMESKEDLLSLLSSEAAFRQSNPQPGHLGKKRPDGIAVNWRERKVYLLEYSRCFDSELNALARADTHKIDKYSRLISTILTQLGGRWTGGVMPFSAGIRGTIQSEVWTAHMATLGVRSTSIQSVLKLSITAVLESLEMVFTARTAAIASLNTR